MSACLTARICGFAILALSAAPSLSFATGFTDAGQDMGTHAQGPIVIDGSFRVRGGFLYNLDLDRGPTPNGRPLFAVPKDGGQTISAGDVRLRTDVAAYSPSATLAVKLRADVFDGAGLSDRVPEGEPARADALVINRFYGEALTPVGVITAGRMGSTWGVGLLANGGDCAECEHGDAADRLAFVTPLAGHLFAIAYDVTAIDPGVPQTERPAAFRAARATDTISVAFLRWRSPDSVDRRRRAGKWTGDYGAVFSQRHDREGGAAAFLATPMEGVPRGLTARVADGWVRVVGPALRIELEAAIADARVARPSVIPGVEVDPVTSRTWGGALESDVGAPGARVLFGIDAGVASGDPAYGFSSASAWDGPAGEGDLRGAQALPPWDTTANDFRFHTDYRVDRILFREIIGTVTDAAYLKPHVSVVVARASSGTLTASVAAIGSRALHAASTPGGDAALGVEIDPTLAWDGTEGLSAVLEHAVLFPMAGLDNREMGMSAKPAQVIRLRLGWRF